MTDRKNIICYIKETFRFICSSVLASVLDYAVYIFMYEVLRSDINLCYSVSKGVGAVENFFVNNYIVFKKKGEKGVWLRFVMFMATVVVTAAIGNLVIVFFYETLGLPALWAKLLTDISTFVISYTSQKYIIFKSPGSVVLKPCKAKITVRDFGKRY